MINNLIKYRLLFLVIIIGLLLFSLSKVSSININTDVSQFFPTNDPDFTFYESINTKLQKDEYLLLIGLKNCDSILKESLLKDIIEFSNTIEKLDQVKKLTGLHNIKYSEHTLFGTIQLPYVDYSDTNHIRFNKTRTLKNYDLTQNFITQNFEALFIWVEINDTISNDQLEILLEEIDTIKQSYEELEVYMWGRKFIDQSFKQLLIQEIGTLGLWILIFLCVAIFLIFKNPIALLFPLFLVTSVVILFICGMVLLDKPLGTMSNLFPTIILIVGISDVIHMGIKFNLETNKNEQSVYNATYLTLKEIGWTTFVTSFTTAIGFFILLISPMKAMRNFGIESGIVVLLTYLLTLLLLPTFFMLFKNKNIFAIRPVYDSIWKSILKQISSIKRYPNQVLHVYSLLIIISLFGIYKVNTNSHQYSIPKNSELYKDYTFFEKYFGGSRTFELVLTADNGHKLNELKLLKISNRIHDYLSNEKGINTLKSPIIYYRNALSTKGFYKNSNFSPNLTEGILKKIEKEFFSKIKNNFLYDQERTVFKFSGQIKDIGRNDIKTFNKSILTDLYLIIGTEPLSAHISGLDHLIDKSHELSINHMMFGLLLAILVVGIVLGLIFKNLSLTILALILNIIPVVLSAGILGLTQLELRGEITLMFTVGFVIAIDDTIHLLSKFQWERKKGASLNQAMDIALSESGKAILATSIILVGGFFILLISNSIEIFTLGLIVGIMSIITLSVDLILAPVLILNWFRKYL